MIASDKKCQKSFFLYILNFGDKNLMNFESKLFDEV